MTQIWKMVVRVECVSRREDIKSLKQKREEVVRLEKSMQRSSILIESKVETCIYEF